MSRLTISEAERLRKCRRVFQRAVAERIGMDEARHRLIDERWADADRRLAEKRCGTRVLAPIDDREGDDRLMWWQR